MKSTKSDTQNSTQSILEKFRYKCVRCRRPTKTVHEIVPKSLRPNDWWEEENRVPLCRACHDWAHRVGTSNSANILRQLRDQRLEEYANGNGSSQSAP